MSIDWGQVAAASAGGIALLAMISRGSSGPPGGPATRSTGDRLPAAYGGLVGAAATDLATPGSAASRVAGLALPWPFSQLYTGVMTIIGGLNNG